MATAPKTAVWTLATAISAALLTNLAIAANPVVVWDGMSSDYDFSNLSRTVGDNTYTLNLNAMNSAASDGSYLLIGDENAKAAITITAQNANEGVMDGFGTTGEITVIMKCSGVHANNGSNRALISLLDNQKYSGGSVGSDNSVKIGASVWAGSGRFIWQGHWYQNQLDMQNTLAAEKQVVALAYGRTAGTSLYVNGTQIAVNTGLKSGTFTTPYGIALGGVDTDGSTEYYAMTGMKIEAVAIFTSTLSAQEIENYAFPSLMGGEITVSSINDRFGTASEIDLYLANGATITGDTTFTATKVNFHCEGSFTIAPPANNAAVFDFSNVSGQPVIAYSGALPVANGNVFSSNTFPTWVTDPAQWTGTILLKSISGVQDLNPNSYGNANSTVRLSGISGFFPATLDCTVPVELTNGSSGYGLDVNNGYSRNNDDSPNKVVIRKLKGDGELWTSGSADKVLMNLVDFSEFLGKIQLVNKTVVLGEYIPTYSEFNTSGGIYIGAETTVALPAGKQWRADGGVHVYGTFKATDIGETQLRANTTVTTYDGGTFVLTNTSTVNEQNVDYARVRGSGTLRFEGTGAANWRILSKVNFPSTMTLENEIEGGLVVTLPGADAVNTIGSLSGSKNLRSDWGDGNRDLKILQAKDTTWSGVFVDDDRFGTVIVAPGADSAGTLTLSGTQTDENNLSVESGAKVNVTGTWAGAAAVAGTFGGTGTLTGDLALADGATLNIADVSNLLDVGGVTVTGAVKIVLPKGTPTNSRMIISTEGEIDISDASFEVYIGETRQPMRVMKTTGGLKIATEGTVIKLR